MHIVVSSVPNVSNMLFFILFSVLALLSICAVFIDVALMFGSEVRLIEVYKSSLTSFNMFIRLLRARLFSFSLVILHVGHMGVFKSIEKSSAFLVVDVCITVLHFQILQLIL